MIKLKFLFTLICFSFLFRDILGRYLPLGEYYFIAVAFIDLFFMVIKNKFKINNIYIFLFNTYILLLLFKDLILNNPIISFVGALNYLLFLNYFYLKFKLFKSNKHLSKYINFLIITISFGAIVNFFVTPNIFGLINETIYSNEENLTKLTFTKRAISFIKSPQSLGFVMALVFLLQRRKTIKHKISLLLTFLVGIITFSKSFFLTISASILLRYKRKLAYIIALIITCVNLIDINLFSEGLQRIINVYNVISSFTSSDRFQSYYYFLTYEDLPSFLLGNGIGKLSRGAEILSNSNEIFRSSESFIIQTYYEIGIIGLLLFILLMFNIFRNLKNKEVFIVVLFLSIFTPSLYGYGPALFFYYFLFLNYSYESVKV
jgi:hypothetical protein